MNEIVVAIVGSGALSAVIAGFFGVYKDKQAYIHMENAEEKEDMQALKRAVRLLLFDRVRFLALGCIQDKQIDPDMLRLLNEMHDSYHNSLGGNGDLDKLMVRVNDLPLKSDD